eukprot:CAMPEP_0204905234 /NCGR_PEP_ID=MMETSP1397-20131031/5315_1 /ASSEMBLY_ACC=CAM_ASM_000891 /TAXON_ID=49980 /ORGANISM="Climacostomum Climacostomum virens, Strain Stock W-24" /LENGTH=101 /DNA_ID=CAMNT_0052074105 /DNA_START=408 /DNA_END=714 /DNA_ORIENTATION=-
MMSVSAAYNKDLNVPPPSKPARRQRGPQLVILKAPISESEILEEEANFRAEIRKLFYPDSNFVAAGMNRKNSEEDEAESCESSEDDVEEFTDVDATGDFFH